MSTTEARQLAREPLCSIADVELFAGSVPVEDMPRVKRLIDFASSAVRRYCRQTLSLVLDDEIFLTSSGTALIVLPERPVINVESVEAQFGPPNVGEAFTRAVWAASGYYTWDAFGRVRRLDGLPWGLRYDPVTVVYSHGYEEMPDDIVGLVAAKVAGYLTGAEANPGGLKSLQVGAMSESYSNFGGSEMALGPGALSQAEKDALDSGGYRLRTGALDIGTQ